MALPITIPVLIYYLTRDSGEKHLKYRSISPNDERYAEIVEVTWGGVRITTKGVLDKFDDAVRWGRNLTMENSLFDNFDPKKGERKICVIDYRLERPGTGRPRPLIRKTALEYDQVTFAYTFKRIKLGDHVIEKKPEVYERFNSAHDKGHQITITPEVMGRDPGGDWKVECVVEFIEDDNDWEESMPGKLSKGDKWPEPQVLKYFEKD